MVRWQDRRPPTGGDDDGRGVAGEDVRVRAGVEADDDEGARDSVFR
jgi:hypothetical protein